MANIKISELDASASLDGSELVEIVQGGTNVQTTTQDIADLAPGGSSGPLVVIPQTTDFNADGVSGTIYTNSGAVDFITMTLLDSEVGTQITITPDPDLVYNMGIYTVEGINAYGYDGGSFTITDSTLGYTVPGASTTFTKINATS